MFEVEISLSEGQMKKMLQGKPVQLKAHALHGKHRIKVGGELHKRVHRARMNKKGMRIHMSPEEAEGSGIREILAALKAGYDKYVKPVVAPLLREGAHKALDYGETAANALTGNVLAPELRSLKERYGNQAIDSLGRVTGAYGLHGITHGGALVPLLGVLHPAMHPYAEYLPAPGLYAEHGRGVGRSPPQHAKKRRAPRKRRASKGKGFRPA